MDDDGESPASARAHGIDEGSLLQAAIEIDGATLVVDANDAFADNAAAQGVMPTRNP